MQVIANTIIRIEIFRILKVESDSAQHT
uniref:Uncharacterized protein n=1 Tax=Anguilla anguilla TaxID=7936 RepID=A0A0E9XCX8_ANGAN